MRTYKVKNVRVMTSTLGTSTLHATLLESHYSGLAPGKTIITSPLHLIDFERGIAVTKNSIYLWEPK